MVREREFFGGGGFTCKLLAGLRVAFPDPENRAGSRGWSLRCENQLTSTEPLKLPHSLQTLNNPQPWGNSSSDCRPSTLTPAAICISAMFRGKVKKLTF